MDNKNETISNEKDIFKVGPAEKKTGPDAAQINSMKESGGDLGVNGPDDNDEEVEVSPKEGTKTDEAEETPTPEKEEPKEEPLAAGSCVTCKGKGLVGDSSDPTSKVCTDCAGTGKN